MYTDMEGKTRKRHTINWVIRSICTELYIIYVHKDNIICIY